jgi:hypothetical protein
VLVSLKKFIGTAAIASFLTATMPAQDAQGQAGQGQAGQGQAGQGQAGQGQAGQGQAGQGQAGQGQAAQGQAAAQPAAGGAAQKNWKDRAEYDLYESITKEAAPAKRLELLNQWNEKYAASEFKLERQLLYLDTHQKLGQAPKMLESAKQVVAIDPQNVTALYWIAYLTTSLNNTAPDALDAGEKAAQALINAQKPATTSDADWAKAKQDLVALGHKTLGWVNMIRKNGPVAQQHFMESLKLNPNAGEISYWLGQTIVAEKKPETYSVALYHFARAAAYDGAGALPAEGRKQVDDYLTKAYTGFHGDTSGLAELKTQAKGAAVPPEGYKIKSVADIGREKQAAEEEMLKNNPLLATWNNLKGNLQNDAAMWDQMKDAQMPKLQGTVVSADPKAVVLALSDASTPEVTLTFDAPVKAEVGSKVTFQGIAKSYTKEPFMLTMAIDEMKDVQGLSTAAPAKRPAASKAKPRRR